MYLVRFHILWLVQLPEKNFVMQLLILSQSPRTNIRKSRGNHLLLCTVHTYLILLSAVLVTTSAPCSKSNGILFANLNILRPWKQVLYALSVTEIVTLVWEQNKTSINIAQSIKWLIRNHPTSHNLGGGSRGRWYYHNP